jgi:glycosyltransferase involved in cell wall biosynthesis
MSSPRTASGTLRVSLVMPAYNTGRHIGAAVRSALDTGSADFEFLIVDDRSTDRTVEEERAIDPRVAVIQLSASGGRSRPRSLGIQHARAQYIALLDSDDLLKPGNLAASVAAVNPSPCAGFAFGNCEKMDAEGDVFETFLPYVYPLFRGLNAEAAGGDWRLNPESKLDDIG